MAGLVIVADHDSREPPLSATTLASYTTQWQDYQCLRGCPLSAALSDVLETRHAQTNKRAM
jgi:hypothetical protein